MKPGRRRLDKAGPEQAAEKRKASVGAKVAPVPAGTAGTGRKTSKPALPYPFP